MPSDSSDPRTRRISRRDFGRLSFAAAVAVAGGCGGTSSPEVPSAPRLRGPDFPRTAAYFLAQQNLPAPAQLARYDVVVIDSEWHARLGAGFFDELRRASPEIRLLAYVNVVDYPPRLGDRRSWSDRYALWQFTTQTDSRFPREWLARTAAGEPVSQWPDTVMTNLTDVAPRVGGQTFAEYAAHWVVDQVWSARVWDGVFLDAWGDHVWTADRDAWDIRGNGTDVQAEDIYGIDNPWEQGIDSAEKIMRAGMPEAILVANGSRTLRNRQLNGRAWEDFADSTADPERADDSVRYVDDSSDGDHNPPPVSMTIDTRGATAGSAEDYRRARYFLTATLLQDGYWAPVLDSSYTELGYYDEMDGGGLGRGYLGKPLAPNPGTVALAAPFDGRIGSVADGVYRRDFDRGTVLHNATDTSRTIDLEQPFRRLRGSQAPEVNNGEVTRTVTVAANDGLVLVRTDA
ncbi:putative glycoside hydrolase [Rhodococcus sp. NPDC059234]|uniref:putative glycoside hydrolase n=1 Tax=Rhodococcus sp. NPDC059234 TaxID=3346781 RepID=UPI00366A9869